MSNPPLHFDFNAFRRGLAKPRHFLCLALLVLAACSSKVQKVSTDIGNGMRKGDPPMCFQDRGEARPTVNTGKSDIWVHLNNTCSYDVMCVVYDDVTENNHNVGAPAYGSNSFLLAAGAPANRVTLKFDCTWKP